MEDKLDTSKGVFLQPIGTIRSCFKSCVGTYMETRSGAK